METEIRDRDRERSRDKIWERNKESDRIGGSVIIHIHIFILSLHVFTIGTK